MVLMNVVFTIIKQLNFLTFSIILAGFAVNIAINLFDLLFYNKRYLLKLFDFIIKGWFDACPFRAES